MTAKENYLNAIKQIQFEVNTITCSCGKVNDVKYWNCRACGKKLQ